MASSYIRVVSTALLLAVVGICASAQTTAPDLLVSSRNTDSVKRFDGTTGEYLGDFIESGAGGLGATQEVAFGPDGNLYVSGRDNSEILQYDGTSGAFQGPFTSGYQLDNPTKFTFGPEGLLYVSQWGAKQSSVARFDAVTGDFVDEFTDDLNTPMDHAWDETGRFYVVSFGDQNVLRYSATGVFDGVFASTNLQGPANLWFDDDGSLLVLDWQTGSAYRYDATGQYVETFLSGLARAEGFAFDSDGLLYICDWQLNHVNTYDSQNGDYIDEFASGGGLLQPNSLAFFPASTTGIGGIPGAANFKLFANEPNPFAATTTIRYSLKTAATVTLDLVDALGRRISVLDHGLRSPGQHEVDVRGAELGEGVFFYRLSVDGFVESRKLVHVRRESPE